MWVKKFSPDGKLLGYAWTTSSSLFFFGTRHLPKDQLELYFPEFEFCFLKQVHGQLIVPAESTRLVEADGHWTDQPGLALAIQTADCLPVLAQEKRRVFAVHAGWKGLELGILKELRNFCEAPETLLVGPHIKRKSFEVGKDVGKRLAECLYSKEKQVCFDHSDSSKHYVDLEEIGRDHLASQFPRSRMEFLDINTFEDPDFASYRRSGGTSERQYSFVVRLF